MFDCLRNTNTPRHDTYFSNFSGKVHNVENSVSKPFSVQLLSQIRIDTTERLQHNALQNLKHELNQAVNRIVNYGVKSEIGANAQQEIAQVILGLADKLSSGAVHFKQKGAAVRLILRILNPDQIEKNLVKGLASKTFHGLKNITQNPSVKPHLYTTSTWVELTKKLIEIFPDLSEKKMNDVGSAIFSTLCEREKDVELNDLGGIVAFIYGDFLKYAVMKNVCLGESKANIDKSMDNLTRTVSPECLVAKQSYFINKFDENSYSYKKIQKMLKWAQAESNLFRFTSSSNYSGEFVPGVESISAYNNRIQDLQVSIVQKTSARAYEEWLTKLAAKCKSKPLEVIWEFSPHSLYAAALAARQNG